MTTKNIRDDDPQLNMFREPPDDRVDYTKQKGRVLRHLRDHNTINPMQAMKEYGIMRLAAVIFTLREEGYTIETKIKKSTNRYGEPCHYAIYYYHTH